MEASHLMDFGKLNGNEKLAVYGAIASVVGPILATFGFGFGVGWLTLLLAIAMLAIVFMPQLSPSTQLPGSKGSLMLIVGGIAGVSAALALLSSIGLLGLFGANIVFVVGWLLGIAGGLLMGWAGWQEFQAEGGKFQIGTASSASAPSSDASAPPAAAAAPPAAPASETRAAPAAPVEPAAPAAPASPVEPAPPPPPAAAEPAMGDEDDDDMNEGRTPTI
jgi:hypothetical protein